MRPILITALLTFALQAQMLRTEGDLHNALTEGWLTYDAYLLLLNLAENKLAPCGPLDELLWVPELGEEEVARLENLCETGEGPPADLYEKTALFVDWAGERARGRKENEADYRFTRDLADTSTAAELEHWQALRHRSPHLEMLIQARANARGEGYVTRNFLSLKERGPLRELSLGNFRLSKGLGLTLGGTPLPYAYAPEAPAHFTESFLLPRNTLANGAYAGFRAGPLSPFAVALWNDDPYSSAGLNRTLGAGIESGAGAWRLGLLALRSDVRTVNEAAFLVTRAAGTYGTYRRPGISVNAEISLSDSGLAGAFEALTREGAWEAGSGLRAFSQGYVNPPGRGKSPFSARTQWLRAEEDSLQLRGLRRGEREMNVFAIFHGAFFSVRPSLAAARSDIYGEERLETSLRETFTLPWKKSHAALWQNALFRDTGEALPATWEARVRFDTQPWRQVEASLSARAASLGPAAGESALGVKIQLLGIRGLELSGGLTRRWAWEAGKTRAENEIRLEEKTALPGPGELKVYSLFTDGFYSPQTLGVSLHESF